MDFLWCPSASWLAALFILSCFSAQHSCTNVLSGLPCAYLSGLIIIGKLSKVKIVKMRAAVIGKAVIQTDRSPFPHCVYYEHYQIS